jgi:endogenous inhibitor of DNA gyrase (YacG/DUF329 family)
MENDQSDNTANSKKCPECGTVFSLNQDNLSYSPFCSEQCKSKDLWSWLSGQYYIPDSLQIDDNLD